MYINPNMATEVFWNTGIFFTPEGKHHLVAAIGSWVIYKVIWILYTCKMNKVFMDSVSSCVLQYQ